MNEVIKLLKNYPAIKEMIHGEVIDIGCGNSPVTTNCDTFDLQDGDANYISRYVHKNMTLYLVHIVLNTCSIHIEP